LSSGGGAGCDRPVAERRGPPPASFPPRWLQLPPPDWGRFVWHSGRAIRTTRERPPASCLVMLPLPAAIGYSIESRSILPAQPARRVQRPLRLRARDYLNCVFLWFLASTINQSGTRDHPHRPLSGRPGQRKADDRNFLRANPQQMESVVPLTGRRNWLRSSRYRCCRSSR
jgi:hypothetical protein